MLTQGSFFTGAGGFDLGAKREGIKTVFTCEIEPYARSLLRQHYPNALHYGDITQLTADSLPYVDIISAGFPCQDISPANTKNPTGIYGKRSSLAFTALKLIGGIRPRYFVLENSPMLIHRGFNDLLAAIAHIGYNAQWEVIRASWFGHHHRRARLIVVAYPDTGGQPHSIFQRQIIARISEKAPASTNLQLAISRIRGQANNGDIRRGARVSNRVHRLALMGNAVNVDVAQYIFACIKNHHQLSNSS